MKELSDILSVIRKRAGEAMTLVTVVAVEGSTYRRPGARMLVLPEGAGRIGSISGGCLEDEVCRKAWWLAEAGPVIATYDTGLDDEPGAGGYSLGCRGRVTVLIERVEPGNPPGYLEFLAECQGAGRFAAVATVIEGGDGAAVGDRLMLTSEDDVRAGIRSTERDSLEAEVRTALREGRSRHIAPNGGSKRVFIEVVPPPVHLLVCGAGHDAEPLVQLAKQLGWRVSVVSKRPTARARLVEADVVVPSVEHALTGGDRLSRRSAAVVMSHNYAADLKALKMLIGSSVSYIGVLGPRHRTDTLLSDLSASGLQGSATADLRIHSPVGLDIGAESPEQVALAMVAEVQAFFAIRSGGSLRDKEGPIHDSVQGGVQGPVVDGACSLDGPG